MFQANMPNGWTCLGRAADILSILGLPTLLFYYWGFIRKISTRRSVRTRILSIERQFAGLICAVSAPLPNPHDRLKDPTVIREIIESQEEITEDLLKSGIGSVIKSMSQHLGRLQHCWFVGSADSQPYLDLLAVVCQKHFPDVCLHGPIKAKDVYTKIDHVYEEVLAIFRRCEQETGGQLKPRDIVTDLTAGTKIMSVGMAMACLESDRNIQYIEQQDQKTIYEIEVTWDKIMHR